MMIHRHIDKPMTSKGRNSSFIWKMLDTSGQALKDIEVANESFDDTFSETKNPWFDKLTQQKWPTPSLIH